MRHYLGAYEIVALLVAGGMGQVYLVRGAVDIAEAVRDEPASYYRPHSAATEFWISGAQLATRRRRALADAWHHAAPRAEDSSTPKKTVKTATEHSRTLRR